MPGRPERRWLVLGSDGRHTWLGRGTDPSDEEVLRVEAALAAAGQSGWLAVLDVDYWIPGEVKVLAVRALADAPEGGLDKAVTAFRERRRAAIA